MINELASGTTRERSNSKERSNILIKSLEEIEVNMYIDDDKYGMSIFNLSKNIGACDEGMSPALKIGY